MLHNQIKPTDMFAYLALSLAVIWASASGVIYLKNGHLPSEAKDLAVLAFMMVTCLLVSLLSILLLREVKWGPVVWQVFLALFALGWIGLWVAMYLIEQLGRHELPALLLLMLSGSTLFLFAILFLGNREVLKHYGRRQNMQAERNNDILDDYDSRY
jgi:hypothetical protein